MPPRPASHFVRAILLPVDVKVPQLLWVNCERIVDDEDGLAYDRPKIDHLLGRDSYPEWKPIKRNPYRNIDLDHTTNVICRGTFLIDGSISKQSVIAVTRDRLNHDWRGPILVLSEPGLAIDPRFFQDITLQDFRHAVDYFLTCDTRGTFLPGIKGIETSGEDDEQFFGSVSYIEAGVPQDHSAEHDEGQHGTDYLGGICTIL